METIPHLLPYGRDKKLLITMAGREPLCLEVPQHGARTSAVSNKPKQYTS